MDVRRFKNQNFDFDREPSLFTCGISRNDRWKPKRGKEKVLNEERTNEKIASCSSNRLGVIIRKWFLAFSSKKDEVKE
jgi:hypothetical protein